MTVSSGSLQHLDAKLIYLDALESHPRILIVSAFGGKLSMNLLKI